MKPPNGSLAGSGGDKPRLGLLGGTFDPPHVGHLVMAMTVREALALDRVVLLVAGDPWQKSGEQQACADRGVSPAADRLAMTRAAVRGLEGIEVSDMEVRRPGPTYTVETLEVLHDEHPEADLFWILGADALAGLPTWHRYEEIGDFCTVVVVDRPGATLSVPDGVEVTFVEAPRLDVSSTELRRRVGEGRSLDFLVPTGAISVINQRGLYAGGR